MEHPPTKLRGAGLTDENSGADQVSVREYWPADAVNLHQVRNTLFPPLTLDQWLATRTNSTVSLAYLSGEPASAILFDVSDFLVVPSRVVRGAQENAVEGAEDLRGGDETVGALIHALSCCSPGCAVTSVASKANLHRAQANGPVAQTPVTRRCPGCHCPGFEQTVRR